jgi:hypothetical protein
VKQLVIVLLCLILTADTKAQPTLDTLNSLIGSKPSLFARFDTKNSFIGNSRAKIFGIKAGLNYGKRLYFGAGYNQMYGRNPAFDRQVYYTATNGKQDSVTSHLSLFYISIHAEYVFHQAGHWKISMPLQFGIGETSYRYQLSGINRRKDENMNLLYEPGISIEYKIVRWVGLGADLGYRFMISDDPQLGRDFTAPTYAFKLLIYYAELYKSLFPNSPLSQRL